MAPPKQILSQTAEVLKKLTPVQKGIAAILVIAVLGSLIFLSLTDTGEDHAVLYSSLTEKDAAAVIAELKSQGIGYELTEHGTTVMVPRGLVYETRLNLAGQGLPKGGGVGFEIFDKSNLGATDFVQHVNYQRALQGELARTIKEFEAVTDARVHIASPRESVFIEEAKPVSASVSLTMSHSVGLSRKEIQSVVNLVAGAVPRLAARNVTVVDTTGRLLYPMDGLDSRSALAAGKLKYINEVERNMRHKVESMFDEVLGENKAVARVNVDIDFSEVDSTEQYYDPEGQVVRSEELVREQGAGGDKAQGIPGVKGELATFTESGETGDGGSVFSRNNAVKNYEISNKITHIKEEVGSIKRVSVAVMVDGTYEEVRKEGGIVKEYRPRSPEDIAWLTKMAKNAIGFDEDRGDQVEVASMPFRSTGEPEPVVDDLEKWRALVEDSITPLLTLVGILGFFLFVVRPFIKLLVTGKDESLQGATGTGTGTGAGDGDEEEEIKLKPRSMTDREKIYRLAQSDPDRAADLVRRWLREGE